jgi:hypothetical protein
MQAVKLCQFNLHEPLIYVGVANLMSFQTDRYPILRSSCDQIFHCRLEV